MILEGTDDPHPGPDAVWRAYEFPCKPGDPDRRPVRHLALSLPARLADLVRGDVDDNREPWLVRLIVKLLRGDADVKPLLAVDPFPDAPPRLIRATLWRYAFTRPATVARRGGGGRCPRVPPPDRARRAGARAAALVRSAVRRYATRKASKDDHTLLEDPAKYIIAPRLAPSSSRRIHRDGMVSDASEGKFRRGEEAPVDLLHALEEMDESPPPPPPPPPRGGSPRRPIQRSRSPPASFPRGRL